ncbi:unnamed protein product, partial [Phaeothamnion confervicola]
GGALDERLWREHSAELLRFGTLLVGPTDAHDVVSAAFLRSVPRLRDDRIRNQRAYLFRSVTNEALDHRRRRANRWKRDLRAVMSSTASAPNDSHVDVRRAVADLSVRQRSVVYLAYWEDMPERAIADVLGISSGSVRRHLVRARAHLRKALHD